MISQKQKAVEQALHQFRAGTNQQQRQQQHPYYQLKVLILPWLLRRCQQRVRALQQKIGGEGWNVMTSEGGERKDLGRHFLLLFPSDKKFSSMRTTVHLRSTTDYIFPYNMTTGNMFRLMETRSGSRERMLDHHCPCCHHRRHGRRH